MRLTVVGTGYVGLVVGACLAETGNDVVCVDVDERKIRGLRRGRVPIYEPGLDELVQRNQTEKRLVFSTTLSRAARKSEVIFIAVGTPPGEDGSADVQYVLAAATELARVIQDYTVVAIKSTVPVGTAERVRDVMGRVTSQPFSVVSNPEFLKQGSAVEDFLKPDRVVVGVDDARAREIMRTLYAPFTPHRCPDHHHGLCQRRAEQVCRQRHAGDPRLLHERDRQRVRAVRRQRGRGPTSRGLGRPHRAILFVSWYWLRR